MQEKILFLGHNSSSGQGFVDTLGDSSFQIEFTNETKDIKGLIQNFEISLIVCALHPSHPGWDRIKQLAKNYPHFPMVYILAQDSPHEGDLVIDGFHKVVRPLTHRKKFTRKVKDLIQVGRWVERGLQESAGSLAGQFFENLDLNHVVDRLLQHFGNQVECKNIYWVQAQEMNRYIEANEVEAEVEETQFFNRSAFLQALYDSTENQVYSVLKSFPLNQKYIGRPISLTVKDSYRRDHILVPILSEGKALKVAAYLVFENVQTENPDFLISQVNETLRLLKQHITYSLEFWRVQSETFLDDLTELYNQKYLGLVLDNEINRASRKDSKFSVLFLDVDFFKVVNDTRGHWIGSKVLIELGKMLKASIRTCDYAFRYGGDEYVMILPDTDRPGAEIVAERIRSSIENNVFTIDGMELNITVSIGLATFPDHATTQKDIIRMADEAMYCGKNKSRNIVYVAS